MQTLLPFLPMDRRKALAQGRTLPEYATGAVLFADISGFTPLTKALADELGRRAGAEELLRHINPIYEALVDILYQYRGSVIGFAGDAITCWLDDTDGPAAPRAVACALKMQSVMFQFMMRYTPGGKPVTLGIKIAVAVGPTRRFLVGDPDKYLIEALAGNTLVEMAEAENHAQTGEVIITRTAVAQLDTQVDITEWRGDFAVITGLKQTVPRIPWPALSSNALDEDTLRAWVLPPIYNRLQAGVQFLGDLRLVSPLFVRFGGIDFEKDEHAGEKLDMFIRRTQEIIYQLAGQVLQLIIGDKGAYLYCIFGAPVAYEDDPRRALAAALALQQLSDELEFIEPLQIGVTRGEVWTGACGAEQRHCYTVMGNMVNMSARLMAKAQPGQTLVLEQLTTAASYQFQHVGDIVYKGFALPQPTYEVVGEKKVRSKTNKLPLVGREAELNQLFDWLTQTKSGQGQVVIIEAEAGLGKSRLAAEWMTQVEETGLKCFLGAAQSIEPHTPYRAWRDLLSAFFGLEESMTPPEQKAQIESRVQALAPDTMVYLPLLSDILVKLVLSDNELTEDLSAQGRQQALITFLLKLFQVATKQAPLILVLEDVHWLDAISWELALQLTRGLAVVNAPFLLVLVTRPMLIPPAAAVTLRQLPYSQQLSLTELSPAALKHLIVNHVGVPLSNIPVALVELIQRRAEGNPFFAEELLLNLQAHEVFTIQPHPKTGQPQCYLQKDLERVAGALPDSLQGVVLARIDRLPPERQMVLKLAAVIGRTFTHPLLVHLHEYNRLHHTITLAQEIAHLTEREFVQPEMMEPELTYLFKHIVIREVAYDTLLYQQRRPLHRIVATWYRQAHQGTEADSPYLPLLVHHYNRAEEADLERQYAYLAGQQAADQYANETAVTYFSRALELTPKTDKVERTRLLWAREEIYNRQGQREAQAEDLAQLATLAETVPEKAAVTLRQSWYHNNQGNYETSMVVSQQAYDEAGIVGDKTNQAQAMVNLGWATMQQGDYETAIQHYQRAYELGQTVSAFSQMAGALGGLGGVALRQGDYATATEYHREALALRQKIKSRSGQVQSLRNLGKVANAQGDYKSARDYFLQALQVCQEMGDRPNEGRLLMELGESDWRQGAYDQAETHLQQSLILAQMTGDKLTATTVWKNLGTVAYLQGQYDRAIECYEQSLAVAQEIGDRAGAGKTLNNLGLVAKNQGQYDKAIRYYEQSLVIAREIGNRSGIGLTLNNLGLVAKNQGQYDKALDYYEQSLSLLQEIGDRAGVGAALNNLGIVAKNQGQYDKATRYYGRSLVIRREIGDQAGVAATLNNLGIVAYLQGQYDKSANYYEQSLVIKEEIGNRNGAGLTLDNLGALALMQGDLPLAENYYQKALLIHQELNQPQYLVEDWAGLALVACRRGNLEVAQSYAQTLLTLWVDNPTFAGADAPIRALHFTWQVCQVLSLPEADVALTSAAQIMQNHLDKQPDSEAKVVYLAQPHHQALWLVWQAWQEIEA